MERKLIQSGNWLSVDFLTQGREERWSCIRFVLHSSEKIPGGNPSFRNEAVIEKLCKGRKAVIDAAGRHYRGVTVSEFHGSDVEHRNIRELASLCRRGLLTQATASTGLTG